MPRLNLNTSDATIGYRLSSKTPPSILPCRNDLVYGWGDRRQLHGALQGLGPLCVCPYLAGVERWYASPIFAAASISRCCRVLP
jgi:hypothetical protein